MTIHIGAFPLLIELLVRLCRTKATPEHVGGFTVMFTFGHVQNMLSKSVFFFFHLHTLAGLSARVGIFFLFMQNENEQIASVDNLGVEY